MKTEDVAKVIQSKILEWSKSKNKLAIAIDGYTGVGKTTILNALVQINSDVLPVHMDDFILPPAEFKKILTDSTDRSVAFELYRNDYVKVENLVNTFRTTNEEVALLVSNPETGAIDVSETFDCSKSIMIIEGVFMFHPKLLNHLWDKRIYLDGDTEAIDVRRIEREKQRWGEKYFPETHPDSFFGQVIIALKRYRKEYNPEGVADIVLQID